MKYALLTDWHVHTEGFLNQIPEHECLFVWDTDSERGQAAANKYHSTYEADLEKILQHPEVEAVIIEAPTTSHYQLILKAIDAGKHIFVDKPLVTRTVEALEIKAALEKKKARFVLSLESLISGSYRFAKQQIDAGTIGPVVSLYFRRAHAGVLNNWLPERWYDVTQTGGGVTLDLGCHGLALLPYFCGKPTQVKTLMTQIGAKGIDDNSTTIMSFDNQAIGTAFTSFNTVFNDNYLEIIGQQGAIIVTGSPGGEQELTIQSAIKKEYKTKTLISSHSLASYPYPIEVFAKLVDNPALPDNTDYGIDAAVTLTEIIETAYLG